MKTLVYANNTEKAREILKWLAALSGPGSLEATLLTLQGAGVAEREAVRLLEQEIGAIPGAQVEIHQDPGPPEEAIAAQAIQSDCHLVAVAPAGRKGFIRLFYGSMVAHVVQRVSTSVLVVRGAAHVPPRKILVCVSGSRHSLTTVTVCAQLAARSGSELSVLTVLSQLSLVAERAEPWAGGQEAFLASDHPLAAHLRVASQIAGGIGAPARLRVREGLVLEEIRAEIEEGGYDLVAIGTHRAEDFDPVYEDVSDEIVQASPVTTLVVGLRASLP